MELLPESKSYLDLPNVYIEMNYYQAKLLLNYLYGSTQMSGFDWEHLVELHNNMEATMQEFERASTKSRS